MNSIDKTTLVKNAREWALKNGLRDPLKITYIGTTPTAIELQAREIGGQERTAAMRFTKDGTPALYELER